jgi:hypothetical protein
MRSVYTIFDRLLPVIRYASSLRMLNGFQVFLITGREGTDPGVGRHDSHCQQCRDIGTACGVKVFVLDTASAQAPRLPYFLLTPFSDTLCFVAEDVELSSSSTSLVKYLAWWRFWVWTSNLDVHVFTEGLIVVCVIRFTEIVCI